MSNLKRSTPGSRETPGEIPKLKDGDGDYIEEVSIYGNGKIAGGFLFGTHHVLVVLKTVSGEFVLLEVGRCTDGLIHINKQTSNSLNGVLEKRINTQDKASLWRSEIVNTWRKDHSLHSIAGSQINHVIKRYHAKNYHALKQSCRTFVDDICKECCASIRCNREDEWSLW